LSHLWADYNQLSDTIPNFNLPNLQLLHLYANRLTGKLPSFYRTNLRELRAEVNQLSDTIPNLNLPNLEWLWIGRNQFTGKIPAFNLPKLSSLDVQFNQLSGSLPNANVPKLSQFWADHNQLTGTIPPFNYAFLSVLHLHNNQLQGCIPALLKTQCPLLSATGGNISANPNLTTQSWANYWNLNEGACRTATSDFNEIQVSIAPNPVTDWLTIRSTQTPKPILIYNAFGQLLERIVPTADPIQLNWTAYRSGIYFVQIQGKLYKVVKQE
jgi:hypothetical protein